MKDVFSEIASSVGSKLADIMSSCYGIIYFLIMWLSALVIGCYSEVVIITFFCIFTDTIWGIAKSIKTGKYATSALLKNTIIKMGAYFSILLLLISAEHLMHIESQIFTVTFTVIVLTTELISVLGNIAIVKPSLISVKVLRILIVGEVARKLKISEKEAMRLLGLDEKCKRIK